MQTCRPGSAWNGQRAGLDEQERERAWTDRALVEFGASGSRSLRNEIVERNSWIAEVVARRYARGREPVDDLVQVGLVGLIKAVERFDSSRGTPFVVFAMPTVTGEVKRHFRSSAWTVTVPRQVKELSVSVQNTIGDLTSSLGRSPTSEEVAEALGVTSEAVLVAMEAADGMRALSLDRAATNESSISERIGRSDPDLGRVESSHAVEALLAKLPPRERKLIELRYFDGLTQREIADRTGVSQVHVSRLLRTALSSLQRHLPDGVPD